jgi:DNA-binding CsgD family transcriptional regulator
MDGLSLDDAWANRAKEYLASRRGVRTVLPRGLKRKAPRQLSPRLREACALVAMGKSNREVAAAMGVTVGTLKVYLNHAFQILGFQSRAQLIIGALKGGR